jgi:hypothetical protein
MGRALGVKTGKHFQEKKAAIGKKNTASNKIRYRITKSIVIAGLPPAKVLQSLINRAIIRGLQDPSKYPAFVTESEAEDLLSKKMVFNHELGRVLGGIDFTEKAFYPAVYNAFNGEGAAEEAIAGIRK